MTKVTISEALGMKEYVVTASVYVSGEIRDALIVKAHTKEGAAGIAQEILADRSRALFSAHATVDDMEAHSIDEVPTE